MAWQCCFTYPSGSCPVSVPNLGLPHPNLPASSSDFEWSHRSHQQSPRRSCHFGCCDGMSFLPQMIHHLMQSGFADAQDVPEFPAPRHILPAWTGTFQVCQKLFFFSHDRSLPGPAFPKMGAKKEGAAVPFRKTAPSLYIDSYFMVMSHPCLGWVRRC